MAGRYIVSYLSHWETYVSTEFLELLHELRDKWGWTLLRAPEWEQALALPGNTVLFFETYPLCQGDTTAPDSPDSPQNKIAAYPGRKFFFTDDSHWLEQGTRLMKVNTWKLFRTLISTNAEEWYRQYPEYLHGDHAERFVVNCPHSACSHFLAYDVNPDPKPRALLAGFLHSSYPQRMEAFWLSQRNKALGLDYLYHPGYKDEYAHVGKKGAAFAAQLHGYLVAVTDGALFNYVLAKHFEIAAVGALLVTTHQLRRVLATYGFVDGETCLLYTDSAHLQRQLEWALDAGNRARVDAMRAAAWQLIRDRHTVTQRARFLHEALLAVPMLTGGG